MRLCNIDNGKLQITEANISGKLTANVIDGSKLNVNSANIADSVNADWVYAGAVNADNITAGTLNADRINANTLSWDKLIGYIPQGRLCSQDSVIDQLYARWASITDLSVVHPSVTGTLSLYLANSTSPVSAGLNGAGVILNGTTYAWSDIVSGATSTTKTAVFG